jgi:hypothetical protein
MVSERRTAWIPVAALLIAVLGTTLACGSSASPTKVGEVGGADSSSVASESDSGSQSAQEATATPSGPETYEIGDVIHIGDANLVVLGWEVVEGDQFNSPDEGKQFISVDLIIVNTSESAGNVSSMLQMTLRDETAQKYDVDLMASVAAGNSAPDGEISPGERVRGRVGFQVPEDHGDLTFVYDADVFGTGKVFVNLGSEPMLVNPPASLEGETAQETFSIGDVVQMGDIQMVVNEVTFPVGDQYNKPDEGDKFVAVDLTFENTGTTAQNMSSMLQMSLKDASGQTYDVDLMAQAAAGGSSPEGELAPGERLRGQVGFQVPEDAEGLVFVFDADVFGHGKVFVSLE